MEKPLSLKPEVSLPFPMPGNSAGYVIYRTQAATLSCCLYPFEERRINLWSHSTYHYRHVSLFLSRHKGLSLKAYTSDNPFF